MLRSRNTRKAAIIPNRIRSIGKPIPILSLLWIRDRGPERLTQRLSPAARLRMRWAGYNSNDMILMRHGQSEFNAHFTATRKDPGIVDAPLTDLGHAQARAAAEELKHEALRRIVTSPYTRALQTAAPIA